MYININNRELTFFTILEGNPSTFRHFKDKDYQIVCIALDSSSLKKIVVYKALYDNVIYTRDFEEFFSLVDKNKYPSVKQKYRFELVEE